MKSLSDVLCFISVMGGLALFLWGIIVGFVGTAYGEKGTLPAMTIIMIIAGIMIVVPLRFFPQ